MLSSIPNTVFKASKAKGSHWFNCLSLHDQSVAMEHIDDRAIL